MAKFSYATIEKQTRQMVKAIPPGACEACLGSGFVDTIDDATGEIVPMPCRATPACSAHADRALRWLSEMVYWFGVVQLASEEQNG